jgi:hypothetical protein
LCAASLPSCALVVSYNASRMLLVECRPLHVARCPLRVACRLLHTARCMTHVVWTLCVARCAASVASSPYVACRLLSVALVSCTFPHCVSSLHALRCMSHVLRCPPHGPMSHGLRCLSPVPRPLSSVPRCVLRLVCCPLHPFTFACRMVSLIGCLSHLSCWMPRVVKLQSDAEPSHTQRIAPALAIEASAAGEAKR